MEASFFGTWPEPDTDQLSGFNKFEVSNVVKTPTVLQNDKDRFVNKVGMYTSHTILNGYKYMMWLEYEPTFSLTAKADANGNAQSNSTSENWCNFTKEQNNPTFRILFQMGDSYSDWQGVKHTFSAGNAL